MTATFTISELIGAGHRSIIAKDIASFAEAEATLRERFNVVHFEADEDHPGCADSYTACGRVISIDRKEA